MRKILLATPVKGGLSCEYTAQLITLINSGLTDTKIDWLPCSGTSVALARNELAHFALENNFTDMVFWDKDLGEATAQKQLALFSRIISHPEPIVAAQYCGHRIPSEFHGAKYDESAAPMESGLLRMHHLPLGFCKISCDALRKIKANTPERAYWHRELGRDPELRHEFFPTGIMGPNTAEGKLERIRENISECDPKGWMDYVMKDYDDPESPPAATHVSEFINGLIEIISDTDYSANTMYGEDFYFCKLARDAGIEMFVDTRVIIPHRSEVLLPLPVETLKNELAASWRVAPDSEKKPFSIVVPGEPLWPEDYFSPTLARDHCKDVLEGCYDIDYNPAAPPMILDIGANVGAFARWAYKRWPGSHIYCYEPHPDNFKILRKTLSKMTSISAFQEAVSNFTGEAFLELRGFNCGEFCISRNPSESPCKVRIFEAANLPHADILKIDTEGEELNIIKRLSDYGRLSEFSAVMLEFHFSEFISPIVNLMKSAGFREVGRKIASEHRGVLKFLKP